MKTPIFACAAVYALTSFHFFESQTMKNPPKAKKVPYVHEMHQDKRIDNYYWLHDRENPKVIDYLNQENTYTKSVMSHTEPLQQSLFNEMKARYKQDDSSVPYFLNGYWYIARYEKGSEYPIYSRKKTSLSEKEEIMFDVQKMAKGHTYYQLGGVNVSPDNQLSSFSVDTVSRRIYTIRIKNLKTGEILPDVIEGTAGMAAWANDNKTLFYVKKDPKTLRSDRIYKHVLGSTKPDELVYHEKDETFNLGIGKTKSRAYLVIASQSTISNEYRFIPADKPNAAWQVFQAREPNLEYSLDHFNDEFYIRTNYKGAKNFQIMKTPVNKTQKENWREVIGHKSDVFVEGFEMFEKYLVVEQRKNGLIQLYVKLMKGSEPDYFIPFAEESYTAYLSTNPAFDTSKLRYVYGSMTTPSQVMEFDLDTKKQKILKEQPVLGDFKKENYKTQRIWATAKDGAKVPISLVYSKKTKLLSKTPLLLYGYGSYGATIDPGFSSNRLSLLDRGFVFAIAHIRGGQYLGRDWYENGKMLHKKNTFYDFISAAKHLVDLGYTSPEHLYALGGSAGGLLVGAVINMEPKLFKGVIAAVPFVDVVTTMLDTSIPLTTGEYDEWGNPNNKEYYQYMKSYSPYDNVEAKQYPNLLVTTGLHDSQVQYWEPAKWVAKLRDLKTDKNLLLLHTQMSAGHGGASGRFESLKETALEYAFLLKLENISK